MADHIRELQNMLKLIAQNLRDTANVIEKLCDGYPGAQPQPVHDIREPRDLAHMFATRQQEMLDKILDEYRSGQLSYDLAVQQAAQVADEREEWAMKWLDNQW